jgi:3'(2'), 5'-bisphosphate nucleotidase
VRERVKHARAAGAPRAHAAGDQNGSVSSRRAPDISDHVLAATLAADAGRLLCDLRARSPYDGKALGADGDRRSNALLMERLARERPGDAVLSEEARDDLSRVDAERVWIVDPLDGTREYAEAGRNDWAVHVALWAGGDLVAGAVALPARRFVLATPSVAAPPARNANRPLHIIVSRSRAPNIAHAVAQSVGATVVELGSAGAKTAAVVRGDVDAYLHAGGQYEWDSAAPVAVARSAGLHASRLDGSPLVYNRREPYLPDLLVCRAEVADALLEAIRAAPAT